jgi:hypothetical protein
MTMTAIKTTTPPVSTTHGKVWFWDDPVIAAQKAAADVAQLITNVNPPPTTAEPMVAAAAVAAGIGAGASIIGSLFDIGNLGLGVANAVNASRASDKTPGDLELTISNNSSGALVPYGCTAANLDITNTPTPLSSGQSDVFVFTRSTAIDGTSAFTVNFLIRSAATANSIQFSLPFNYSGGSKCWSVDATVDGSPTKDYDHDLQLFGLSFIGTTGQGYPSFSAYFSTIQSPSGTLSIAVYDKSAAT